MSAFTLHIESQLDPSFNGRRKKRDRIDHKKARRMAETAEANRELSDRELYVLLAKQEFKAIAVLPILLFILTNIPSIWWIITELRKFF